MIDFIDHACIKKSWFLCAHMIVLNATTRCLYCMLTSFVLISPELTYKLSAAMMAMMFLPRNSSQNRSLRLASILRLRG